MSGERPTRWRVTTPVAAWLFGLGLLTARPVLLGAAVVPLGYALYAAAASGPVSAELRANRDVSPPTAPPGAAVTVTLTVRNTSDRILPDVRVVDEIPSGLAVRSGATSATGALAPGDELSCRYTLTARAGDHDFGPATVRLRSVAGERAVTTTVDPDDGVTLRCPTGVDPPATTRHRHGPGETATEGRGGQEFFATREYRPGDAMGRIDWRHYAKTGEFVTQQYRDDRAGRTAILVDARSAACRAAIPGAPTGAEYAAAVAHRLSIGADRGADDPTIGAVGLEGVLPESEVDPTGLAWVASGDPQGHHRARVLIDAVSTVAQTGGDQGAIDTDATARGGERVPKSPRTVIGDGGRAGGPSGDADADAAGVPTIAARVADRLAPGAELVVCSPLLDDWPITLAATLGPRDRRIIVLSPDVTDGGSPGARVVGLERQARIDRLEALGTRVVDWQPATGVGTALRTVQRARRRQQ